MWDSLVAVFGTLAGGALVSYTQVLDGRRTRDEQQRQRVTDTTTELLRALLKYRKLFWLLVADIREGHTETREDRADRFQARSEITEARDRLSLTTGATALHAATKEAAWSAIDLGDIELGTVTDGRFSDDVEAALSAGRERSRDAHTALLKAVRAHIHGT